MQLNVMIVDDEVQIRKGIRAKVNWDDLGLQLIGEASDGREALDYANIHNVDIMITDINMPEMDGLMLIKQLSEVQQNMKFIIISGYSEFEYARTAMQYGVSEYLLKPVLDTELQSSLMKVREELLRPESVWIKEHVVKEKLMKRDEALLHLVSHSNDKETILSLMKKSGMEWSHPLFSVGLLKLEFEEIANEYLNDEESFYSALIHMFDNVVGEKTDGCLFKSKNEYEFILLLNTTNPQKKEDVKQALKSFIKQILEVFGMNSTIGLGRWIEGIQLVKNSFKDAQSAVKEKILKGNGKLIDITDILVKPFYLDLDSESKILTQLMIDRKKEEVREYISHLFNNFIQFKKVTSYNQIVELFLEIYFIVKNVVQENKGSGDQAVFGLDGDLTDIISRFESLDQMTFCLYEYAETVIDQISDGHDVSGKEIVNSVRKYINDFYGSDITLNKISKKNHINPIYFSRIFKTYVGENFNNYLTRIRMEEAMKLMNSSSLKIHEISGIVGYDDPKYFSKVFKKHFGTSPSMYVSKT